MRSLTKITALLLIAFWGLATAHCGLERLPGFEFLACCEHPGSAPHEDDDCKQDSCAVVEYGFYKNDSQPASLPVPAFAFSLPAVLWEAPAAGDSPAVAIQSSGPPELAHIWQFSSRAALPPRAPSTLS